MELVKLPKITFEVSRIGLGTWAIGGWMWGGADDQESINAIHAAIDKGLNFIDTAPIYGFGRAEEVVGKAINSYGQRDKLVIATKAGIEWKQGKVLRNSTKERIFTEVEDSLRRLDTDFIDLYQVHWPDPLVAIEQTAEALGQLIQQGKICAVGVSNYTPRQMERFNNVTPLQTLQPPYNIFEREIEAETLPFCKQHGIGVLTYGTLCRGLLSGKMKPNTTFKGDDLRQADPKFNPPRYEQYLKAVAALDRYAQERFDRRVIHLAARWILDQGVDVALWGVRKPDHLQAIDQVWGWKLADEDITNINAIVTENVPTPIGPDFMAPPPRED